MICNENINRFLNVKIIYELFDWLYERCCHSHSSLMEYILEYLSNNKSHVIVLLLRERDEFEKIASQVEK